MSTRPQRVQREASSSTIPLRAGRRLVVHSTADEERVELVEAQGQLVLTIRLTDDGPLVSAAGARLELRAAESLSLASKRITISATEGATLESGGPLRIAAADQIDVRSEDDVRVVGKIIHLN
jgi:hypothetical protein